MYPAWFMPAPRKGKEHEGPKTVGCQVAALSGQLSVNATDHTATYATALSLPMFPEFPPPHADSWQPRRPEDVWLNMPMLRDTPKMWEMWIDQNPDKCLCGIVVMPDGRVSMRGI